MDLQPVIGAVADLINWAPFRYILALFIVWHGIIGRSTAIRWCEALGWNGVMGFLTRIGWLQPMPEAQPPQPVPSATVTELPRFEGRQ